MSPATSKVGRTLAGGLLRLCGGFVAMRVLERRYPDTADAHDYHAAAIKIAPKLRSGQIAESIRLAREQPWDTNYELPVGTSFIRLLSGGVYAPGGPSKPASFAVFSWIGFCGLLCFQRAFTLALPHGDRRMYARLLFLHPSSLFWNCTVGKEPLTTLGLGLGTLGVALTFTGRPRRGLALIASATAMTGLARPQISLYLGFGSGLDLEQRRESSPGGSWFEPPEISTPASVPRAAASVLFRPYPGEARNAPARLAAAESTALMLFTFARLPRVPRGLWRGRPFTGFVLAALLASLGMLSRLSNAGLLVRERAPIMPLYLMLLCLTSPEEDRAV